MQPKFFFLITSSSLPFYLYLHLNLVSSLESVDEPSKIIVYLMTSNNTWQGIATSDWPRTTSSKVELESSNYYLAQETEYQFDQDLDNSEDCWKTHLETSNCTLCQFASFANLPRCKSSQEFDCIFNGSVYHYLGMFFGFSISASLEKCIMKF